MRIPRIYTGQDITAGTELQLDAGASQHIGRALRMQAGDSLSLFNGSGREWPAHITSVDKKQTCVLPDQPVNGSPESPLAIHLAIAISRGDRMDTVIQKSTELGVAAITPIISERTEVRLKGERQKKKLLHWRQVIVSACEQCGRNTLPALHTPRLVEEWLDQSDAQLRFVLHHRGNKGLNPEEHTIADHLKSQGYATACFGKWHLGHHPETLPQQNGFDTYLGIRYSNDMNHPDNKGKPRGSSDDLWRDQESAVKQWNTPLMENGKIVELPVDQRTVTRRYTDRALGFIRENKDGPFFVYLPHSMPHIPLYVPEDVYDPDPQNAYTCVIEHIDAEVGRVMDGIRELGLSENTYVIYTSDNGPWLQFKNHGGSAGPLREGKGTTFEGGQRVPCVIWGPGRVPAGTECGELVGTIDLLPTIASLTGKPLPADRKIDGLDVSALLKGEVAKPIRDEFVHYTSRGDLEGIRQGKWKLLVKKPRRKGKKSVPAPEFMLFDLSEDLGEKVNLARANPDVVEKLRSRMSELDAEIEANARAPWVKRG